VSTGESTGLLGQEKLPHILVTRGFKCSVLLNYSKKKKKKIFFFFFFLSLGDGVLLCSSRANFLLSQLLEC
jgi:membrane-bound acyltransferase YfiQ involved in biofilm formation